MPRAARVAAGGIVFHVLNRGNDRRDIFADQADNAAFLGVMEETQERVPMRILLYCPLRQPVALPAFAAQRQRITIGLIPFFGRNYGPGAGGDQ
jgi:hypothetical protein